MAKGWSKYFREVAIEVIETGFTNTALLTTAMPSLEDYTVPKQFRARGEAVAYIGDDYDPAIGQMLATANALTSLGAQMRREAMGAVNHRADCKARKAARVKARQIGLPPQVLEVISPNDPRPFVSEEG